METSSGDELLSLSAIYSNTVIDQTTSYSRLSKVSISTAKTSQLRKTGELMYNKIANALKTASDIDVKKDLIKLK